MAARPDACPAAGAGARRFVLRDPHTGREDAFSGTYREIVSPARPVVTERYEPIPGSHHVVTFTFTAHAGKTTLRDHITHASRQHRDGHIMSGMEVGMRETLDRLAEPFSTRA